MLSLLLKQYVYANHLTSQAKQFVYQLDLKLTFSSAKVWRQSWTFSNQVGFQALEGLTRFNPILKFGCLVCYRPVVVNGTEVNIIVNKANAIPRNNEIANNGILFQYNTVV